MFINNRFIYAIMLFRHCMIREHADNIDVNFYFI